VRWPVRGAGPPLVLIHGLSGSARWWDPVLPLLARRFTCHLLNMPRFGKTLQPRQTAEWLADWFDASAIGAATIVGHSLGGAAAARVAALRPDVADKLVLVAAAGIPSKRRLAAYAIPLVLTLRATAPAFVARVALDALRTGPEALLRGTIYTTRADVREEARSIRAPTLLIWGERDQLVPLTLADEWLAVIPHSRLIVLPGVGHMPMIERPTLFVDALFEFLDEPRDLGGGGPVGSVRSTGDDRDPGVR
jgi:pimeloyl-ACP methyl ester carboxylesterase